MMCSQNSGEGGGFQNLPTEKNSVGDGNKISLSFLTEFNNKLINTITTESYILARQKPTRYWTQS